MSKVCTKCKEVKPINCFGIRKRNLDGRDSWCKECYKENASKYYKKNKDAVLEKQRQDRINNPDKFSKNNWNYKHSISGIITRIKSVKKYNQKYPEKHKAHTAVSTAIRHHGFPNAKLFLCNICRDRQAQEYHHHKGYEKEHWLDVIPVCKQCHNDIEHRS